MTKVTPESQHERIHFLSSVRPTLKSNDEMGSVLMWLQSSYTTYFDMAVDYSPAMGVVPPVFDIWFGNGSTMRVNAITGEIISRSEAT